MDPSSDARLLVAGVAVRISAASMRQRFHGCTPDYIARRCHGACCRRSTGGTLVTVHRSEAEAVRAGGVPVVEGRIPPDAQGRCPHQSSVTNLCAAHGTTGKPFGCYASPFTLARGGRTLVIRNRYRMLRCYRDPLSAAWGDAQDTEAPMAYHAFAGALVTVLGPETAAYVTGWLDAGGGDVTVPLDPAVRSMLLDNDEAKRPTDPAGTAPAVQ
jgi:hypothetical protein